ncbi:ornithine cyclodeaminase [Brachybacterium sp. AOP25-B2-12]|uniref:ornithine cyclodeaminase n=1 Tax=Brachybacterium sp. AOP25-B2-12 TaxID=3457710 RepID=UPI0040333D38
MTQFLDVASTARWIRRDGIPAILARMTQHLDADLRRWPSFDLVPRIATHSAVGVIELMPTSDGEQYAFKYVNGHPGNPARGLQTVTAFGVLADVDTGYPVLLAEMTLLTALRTAAMSALAARALARPDARVMAMIGAGSQSEFQALGFRGALGIRELRVFDTDPGAIRKLRRNLEPLDFEVTECGSASEAALGADVITTCTADKARNHVLRDADVRPGMHVNAVGGDCPGKTELDPLILDRARVIVEHPPQTRVEGEIQQRPADFEIEELWRIVAGQEPGRRGAEEITVFDSVGFAIADFSALRCAREATAGTDLCQEIDLVAEPEDPRDLFSLVASRRPVPAR